MRQKWVIVVTLICMLSAPAFASDWGRERKTLAGDSWVSSGFGGFTMKWAPVKQSSALFAGLGGAWMIDDRYYIGMQGFWSVAKPGADTFDSSLTGNFDMGYGGLWLGYRFNPDAVGHINFHLLLGVGQVSLGGTRSTFFMFNPTLEYEWNVTEFFNFAVGVGYHLPGNVSNPHVSAQDISGVTGHLSLNFGGF